MELYNLGKVPWEESQLIYHALAELGREALVLLSPETPYVCIGFHQDVEAAVDLDYCRNNKIPVFRREVGGGAVYLDGNQLFFQLILSETNPIVPVRKESFYRKFLQPVIDTYKRIGIPAEYKPINDIVAGGRKISGTGVGEIGSNVVFIGIRMGNNEWLFQRGRQFSGSEVKISAGIKVTQREHKAPGGLIRAVFENREGCFADISISGDFFCYPSDTVDSLTSALNGIPVDNVHNVLKDFYKDKAVETPGVGVDDWLEVLKH